VLYSKVLAIWKHFATDDMLGELYHLYMSQKSESLHQQVTHFAPKYKHFSMSMALSDRVSLVVIIDSIGYDQALYRILKEIDIDLLDITLEYLKRRNYRRQYGQQYKKQPHVRRRKNENIRNSINKTLAMQKEDAEQGFGYAPSLALKTTVRGTKMKHTVCVSCQQTGHSNANSKKCGNHIPKVPKPPMVCISCQQTGHSNAASTKCGNHIPKVPKSPMVCISCQQMAHRNAASTKCGNHIAKVQK